MSASISFLNSDRSALFRQRQQASVSYARMIQNLLRELELRCRYDIGECFDVGVDQFFEFLTSRSARRYSHLLQAILHACIGERLAEFRRQLAHDRRGRTGRHKEATP